MLPMLSVEYNNNYHHADEMYIIISIIWQVGIFIIFQKCTPMLIAVVYGHEEVVLELLSNGADLNILSDVSGGLSVLLV